MAEETIRQRVIRLVAEMRNRTVERGATPAEAAGFAAKIAEWIEKYQIDEAELRQAGGKSVAGDDVEVCENYLRTGKKVFNPGMSQVVNALAQGMCCKCIMLPPHTCGNTNDDAAYGITGDPIDADYVCQVATVVVPALQVMAGWEGREHGYEKAGLVRWTNQYLTGAAIEIKKRLEDDRKMRAEVKRLEHMLANAGKSGALVCVTGESLAEVKRKAAEEAFRTKYPRTRTKYSRTEFNAEAHNAGREAGKRVGLNPTIKN